MKRLSKCSYSKKPPCPENIWLRTCNTFVKIVFYSTDMLLFCVDRFTAIVLWYKYRIDETLMVLSAKLLA